jgi:hypothetical protein
MEKFGYEIIEIAIEKDKFMRHIRDVEEPFLNPRESRVERIEEWSFGEGLRQLCIIVSFGFTSIVKLEVYRRPESQEAGEYWAQFVRREIPEIPIEVIDD